MKIVAWVRLKLKTSGSILQNYKTEPYYDFFLFLGKSLNSSVISKRSWSPSNIDIEPTDRISRRIDDDWREVDRKSTTSIRDKDGKIIQFSRDMKVTPNLYKVKLTQKGYIQFLRYLADVPNLQEYTFCLWFTSSNLTHSHPLFSYSSKH